MKNLEQVCGATGIAKSTFYSWQEQDLFEPEWFHYQRHGKGLRLNFDDKIIQRIQHIQNYRRLHYSFSEITSLLNAVTLHTLTILNDDVAILQIRLSPDMCNNFRTVKKLDKAQIVLLANSFRVPAKNFFTHMHYLHGLKVDSFINEIFKKIEYSDVTEHRHPRYNFIVKIEFNLRSPIVFKKKYELLEEKFNRLLKIAQKRFYLNSLQKEEEQNEKI